jgi:PAS domain S-box-containing protein
MKQAPQGPDVSVHPEPYINQLLRLFSFFLFGALFLSLCATLQKLLFAVPLEWKGYPIPMFAGGTVGLIVGSSVYRYRQICTGQTTLSGQGIQRSLHGILRQVAQFSLFFIAGSLLLCLLTLLQKSLAGYPMQLKMLTIPTLFGGFSGVNVGWYVLELRRGRRHRQEEERQYFNLFENANDLIQMVSLQGEILYVNKAWREALGFSEEQLGKVNLFDVIHPDSLPVAQEKMQRMLAGEQIPRMELKYLTRSGEVIYVEGSSTVSLAQGKPNGFRCILRDISARKKHETQLQEALNSTRAAHQKLNSVLTSVADGILVLDQDNRIIMTNPAVEKLLRVPQAELFGKKLGEIIASLPEGVFDKGSGSAFVVEIPDDEQRQRYLRAHLSPFNEPGNAERGAILLLHDVTEEKELDRMKNEFISTAAHELRTPLTSIMGFSEYMLETPPETAAESKHLLGIIHEQAGNLSAIISDLLDLSRIESGKSFSLNETIFSMPELVLQTIKQLAPTTENHWVKPKLSAAGSLITADRGKIRQLIENIIGNAIKYSPEGGTIKVVGRSRTGYYVLQIIDEGIGMTSEQVERIFEKFYRADYSNTAVSGIGLGMSIVHRIVQAHNGQIRVRSRLGLGTRVTVFLPQNENQDLLRDTARGYSEENCRRR